MDNEIEKNVSAAAENGSASAEEASTPAAEEHCCADGVCSFEAPAEEKAEEPAEEKAEQPAAEFVSQVMWLTEKKHLPIRDAWERASLETDSLCLRPEETKALAALGEVLGRYDAETQCAAVERTRQRLALVRELEEKDRARKNRLSAALGAGAGITLAILLL